MEIQEASTAAKEKLAKALDKKANATVSISKEADTWKAIVEIVEEEYLPGKNIPSMNDILGIYKVTLDQKGNLAGWSKTSSKKRSS